MIGRLENSRSLKLFIYKQACLEPRRLRVKMSLMRRFFPEMRQMMRQMDEALAPFHRLRFPETMDAFTPVADVREVGDKYVIETELPGVAKEDVTFELLPDEHTLIMRAEVKKESDSGDAHIGERYFGRMQRAFTLPTRINSESVQAELKDGILKIEMPRLEEARKPLQISWK